MLGQGQQKALEVWNLLQCSVWKTVMYDSGEHGRPQLVTCINVTIKKKKVYYIVLNQRWVKIETHLTTFCIYLQQPNFYFGIRLVLASCLLGGIKKTRKLNRVARLEKGCTSRFHHGNKLPSASCCSL